MACKNCETPLTVEDQFCNRCGAKVIRNRLTLRNLWEDFSEQFLNYDNKLLQTLLVLFVKPEEVIGNYIHGTRKKYVNVVSYFAIALTLSGLQLFILRKFYPETLDVFSLIPSSATTPNTNIDWVFDYYSIFALINLPMYAVMGTLSFMGLKKFNYTEHLVINTYIMAQYTIVSAIFTTIFCMFGINFFIVANFANLLVIIYGSYCYKRLYALTNAQLFTRLMLFFGLLVVGLILISIIQFGIMYLNGDIQKIIDAEKAKQGISYMASSVINWTS